MNWIEAAKTLFNAEKPVHFTNHIHCEECAEHDETLRNANIETIGLVELGNPSWDPICFCSAVGKLYYTPAFIRLSLETVQGDFYFGQYLFHLEIDGKQNDYFTSCTNEQEHSSYHLCSS